MQAETISCSICLSDKNEKVTTTTCNHNFHKHCLDEWLKTNNTCPYCRSVLYEKAERCYWHLVYWEDEIRRSEED
jgi:hypothetical protein